MKLTLAPEIEQFIHDQVKSGKFASPSAVVTEAMDRMMIESELEAELDDETLAAINRAEVQLDRGEGIDFQPFADDIRKSLGRS